MTDTNVYDYKIQLFDEEGTLITTIFETVQVESTGDREEDRGNANLQIYNLADAYLEKCDAADYTVELTDVG